MSGDIKRQIRRHMLALRRGLSPAEVEKRSGVIFANLRKSGLLEGRRVVALYAAADGEVRTRPLFEQVRRQGGEAALPRVRGKGPQLDFYPVQDWDRLIPSGFGIPEPRPQGEPVEPEEFDFVLVPGVAFDTRGGRLGYGMGCYDRVLDRTRPAIPLVGMAYDFQLLDRSPLALTDRGEEIMAQSVPMEPHDVYLTAVISESQIALPQSGKAINHKEKGERP